ncbi:MAG: hypothetical protein ACLSHO_13920 [Dysosmobacter sp.]
MDRSLLALRFDGAVQRFATYTVYTYLTPTPTGTLGLPETAGPVRSCW